MPVSGITNILRIVHDHNSHILRVDSPGQGTPLCPFSPHITACNTITVQVITRNTGIVHLGNFGLFTVRITQHHRFVAWQFKLTSHPHTKHPLFVVLEKHRFIESCQCCCPVDDP